MDETMHDLREELVRRMDDKQFYLDGQLTRAIEAVSKLGERVEKLGSEVVALVTKIEFIRSGEAANIQTILDMLKAEREYREELRRDVTELEGKVHILQTRIDTHFCQVRQDTITNRWWIGILFTVFTVLFAIIQAVLAA